MSTIFVFGKLMLPVKIDLRLGLFFFMYTVAA